MLTCALCTFQIQFWLAQTTAENIWHLAFNQQLGCPSCWNGCRSISIATIGTNLLVPLDSIRFIRVIRHCESSLRPLEWQQSSLWPLPPSFTLSSFRVPTANASAGRRRWEFSPCSNPPRLITRPLVDPPRRTFEDRLFDCGRTGPPWSSSRRHCRRLMRHVPRRPAAIRAPPPHRSAVAVTSWISRSEGEINASWSKKKKKKEKKWL